MMPTMGPRRALLAVLLALIPAAAGAQQIVADHNAVAACAGIPQQYIDVVRTWSVYLPGESHASGYRNGMNLLLAAEPRYAVKVQVWNAPDTLVADSLHFNFSTWGDTAHASGWVYGYGEEDWYTSPLARSRTAAGIRYCNTHGWTINAIGFGWCWDMTWVNGPGGTEDPVHLVRWAGSSAGGPQGNLIWGLDAGDAELTGNSVCMDTYLAATQSYGDSCAANGWPTTVFFTTGPVDGNDNSENGCQREIKHQYIRQYVAQAPARVLFDYADILCWSDSGEQPIATWNDGGTPRYYPQIHADNMLDLDTTVNDGDHIGQRGAIRLAKAMWWMLARLAGWDGTPAGVAGGVQTVNGGQGLRLIVQPNPFRQHASISYTIGRAGDVELAVYNAIGQRVRTLVRTRRGPGTYAATFEAGTLPAGVYYCRLRAGGDISMGKIVLTR